MVTTYADRTGHTIGCVQRTAAVLAATGEFTGLALTSRQQEDAALDALGTGDIECYCDQYRADRVESFA